MRGTASVPARSSPPRHARPHPAADARGPSPPGRADGAPWPPLVPPAQLPSGARSGSARGAQPPPGRRRDAGRVAARSGASRGMPFPTHLPARRPVLLPPPTTAAGDGQRGQARVRSPLTRLPAAARPRAPANHGHRRSRRRRDHHGPNRPRPHVRVVAARSQPCGADRARSRPRHGTMRPRPVRCRSRCSWGSPGADGWNRTTGQGLMSPLLCL